jgi:hypothetical protein
VRAVLGKEQRPGDEEKTKHYESRSRGQEAFLRLTSMLRAKLHRHRSLLLPSFPGSAAELTKQGVQLRSRPCISISVIRMQTDFGYNNNCSLVGRLGVEAAIIPAAMTVAALRTGSDFSYWAD